jgi:uncharacterized membrane protein
MRLNRTYPYLLIILSLIGLLASFVLTVDTIKFIENPNVNVLCNINPLISCTAIASEWQSHIFGFPNALLGIAAFAMLFAVGVMLFSGGRSKKPLWLLVNLGTLAAMIFVMWFFFESVYRIGALCLYCMITWAVSWPLFLYTTVWNYRENHFEKIRDNGLQKFFNFISKYHAQILIAGYAIIILLILFQFRNFFFG